MDLCKKTATLISDLPLAAASSRSVVAGKTVLLEICTVDCLTIARSAATLFLAARVPVGRASRAAVYAKVVSQMANLVHPQFYFCVSWLSSEILSDQIDNIESPFLWVESELKEEDRSFIRWRIWSRREQSIAPAYIVLL